MRMLAIAEICRRCVLWSLIRGRCGFHAQSRVVCRYNASRAESSSSRHPEPIIIHITGIFSNKDIAMCSLPGTAAVVRYQVPGMLERIMMSSLCHTSTPYVYITRVTTHAWSGNTHTPTVAHPWACLLCCFPTIAL